MPAIIEADDLGLYVVKFRGAGQGQLALLAELVAGEIGRALGLKVPELVFVEVDPLLGRNEPDAEIRDLLKRSTGLNLALDYLPGSTMFDPAAGDIADPQLASMAVWFDAFVTNVDRTPRNPNLLKWHRQLYFIDHGAALYFHHNWASINQMTQSPFTAILSHVLLTWASELNAADVAAHRSLNIDVFTAILEAVPDAWLQAESDIPTPTAKRAAYAQYLNERLAASSIFVKEAMRVRAEFV
nr:HipA family kinase [Alloacidobacterium dinghuense]